MTCAQGRRLPSGPMHEPRDPSTAAEYSLPGRAGRALAGDADFVDVRALAERHGWDPDGLITALGEATADGSIVVCEGVIERLDSFVAVVEELVRLAREQRVTVLLAVPNDAAAPGTDNAASTWTEGAVLELRHLLPAEHRLWHVVSLRGAALVDPRSDESARTLNAEAVVDGRSAASFLLTFGPRASEVSPLVVLQAADLAAERAHARAVAAELTVLRARAAASAP
jgi:hypothetical protein